MSSIHKSVLLQKSIDGLNLSRSKALGVSKNLASGNDFVVIDATFGGGGHSKEILDKYPDVKIIAIDQDKSVWNRVKNKFKGQENRITFINGNFRDIENIIKDLKIEKVDSILFDLGFSSDQLENAGRGFSFLKDEILQMTIKENPNKKDITAREIINNWSEESLADIIFGYGEERFARRIAKKIVEERKKKEIKTTFELVEIIRNAIPYKYTKGKLHFATKTFQAIRIATNDELNNLKIGLEKGFNILKKGGRIAVISFHSLEDRIIKRFYKNKEKEGIAKLINKKVIIPDKEEFKINNRSRSAKLRILEKIK